MSRCNTEGNSAHPRPNADFENGPCLRSPQWSQHQSLQSNSVECCPLPNFSMLNNRSNTLCLNTQPKPPVLMRVVMKIELTSLMMSAVQAMLGSNHYNSLIKLTGRAACIAKIWHDYGLDGHDLTPINMKKHDPLNHFPMVLPYLLWAKYKTRLNCLNGIQICIQMVNTAIWTGWTCMKIMIGNFFVGWGLLQLPKYHKVCCMIVMSFYSKWIFHTT